MFGFRFRSGGGGVGDCIVCGGGHRGKLEEGNGGVKFEEWRNGNCKFINREWWGPASDSGWGIFFLVCYIFFSNFLHSQLSSYVCGCVDGK